MDADIMGRVTGSAYQSQEATLQDYSRRTVRGEVYPAIIKQSGCSVDGVVYFNISLVDIERLDTFEGSLYERVEVEVIFNNGYDGKSGYNSSFKKSSEKATAGFYSVYLDKPNVEVELTTTERAGFQKYSYKNLIKFHIQFIYI